MANICITNHNNKQLLDEVFVISRIIKVEVSQRLRLITLTETLIILDITKTESKNPKLTFFLGSQLATNLKILVAKWKGLVANDKC